MSKPVVYLAGPIAGTKQGEAFEWRYAAAAKLEEYGIDTRSPLRAKASLATGPIGTDCREYASRGWAFTPEGIMTRDHHDCTTADAVLVNLLGAERLTFGTAMEIAWCYDRHIPLVIAIEPEGNPHSGHPMFIAAAKFRCATLDEAIDAVAVILGK
jgi:nucleoside 2-deoxyribosyltransferase